MSNLNELLLKRRRETFLLCKTRKEVKGFGLTAEAINWNAGERNLKNLI